ncbi:MAG: DUF2806 domain-containing protein [Gallionella sp.]
MGFDVTDLAGISEPAKKLIKEVSNGIGSVFRPRVMRKEADAKAYEIRTIAAAEADAHIVKARGQNQAEMERINYLASGDQELIERARIRLLTHEVVGQLNVEAIAEQALLSLPEAVSDKPVADDWRRKFFLGAENICDQDLQFLWGKVLAGEVASPGSYSLRTLEVLKHLSKEEAEIFRQACCLAFRDGWIMKPDNDINTSLKSYGLKYDAFLTLRDAGLMYEGDTLVKDLSSVPNLPSVVFFNNGIYMQLSGPTLQQQQIPSLPFTRAGKELQNLLEANPCMPYLQSVATYFRARGLTVKKGTQKTDEAGQPVLTFEEEF